MSDAGALDDVRATSPVQRLLEDSWSLRSRRASRRELLLEGTVATLFLAVAIPCATSAFADHTSKLPLAALLVALYAIVARTARFPVGAGYIIPSYLVLVPMLLLLPPLAVPLLVALSLALGTFGRYILRRAGAQDLLFSVADGWHAFGPAVVLALGPSTAGIDRMGVYVAAFLAGCLVDLVASTARESLIRGIGPRIQGQVVLVVWLIDACLAPIGLLIAVVARHDLTALLLLVPLAALMAFADRDRNARIAEAHDRLAVVARERARLQSAVHRLGEAFAAKLELRALADVLLHGSIDALDASAGHLTLSIPLTAPITDSVDSPPLEQLLAAVSSEVQQSGRPCQLGGPGGWGLALAISVGGDARGVLAVARADRAFTDDERELISGLVRRAETAAAEIIAHDLLHDQARTDPLTRLGNRRKLTETLADQLGSVSRDAPLLLMLFDLDGFKAYNDTFGHPAGDALLARLGQKLARAVTPSGSAFRLGGDEFCVLLPSAHNDLYGAAAAATDALQERGETFAITASCGSVVIPHEAASADYALQLADKRMYGHKHRRRGDAGEQMHDVLVEIMRAKHHIVREHASSVARLAARVGRRLDMDNEQLDVLSRAADLHDIGTVGIPDAILSKRGPLDADEWDFIHQHTVLGERILAASPALRPVATIVRSTHERWDGTGYPDQLHGTNIPLAARIIAVCDAYNAMLTDCPHRPAWTPQDTREEIERHAGSQFDPAVVAALLHELDSNCEEVVSQHSQPIPRNAADRTDGASSAEDTTGAGAAARDIASIIDHIRQVIDDRAQPAGPSPRRA